MVIGLVISAIAVIIQKREYALKKKVGYEFVAGDLDCTPKILFKVALTAFVVGFANALAGVGPGVMLQIEMLKMDIHPRVVERTANYIAFIMTLCSSMTAVFYDELPMDYAIVFGLMSMIATILGTMFRDVIIKKYQGRSAILVLLLFFMIIVTFISTTSISLHQIILKQEAGEKILEFKSYC